MCFFQIACNYAFDDEVGVSLWLPDLAFVHAKDLWFFCTQDLESVFGVVIFEGP